MMYDDVYVDSALLQSYMAREYYVSSIPLMCWKLQSITQSLSAVSSLFFMLTIII